MTVKVPFQKLSQGFTLIESLVVVIIVGVIAAIATPSLLVWFNNNKIETAMSSIKGALDTALSTSVRINEPCTVNLSGATVTASPARCLPSGPVDLDIGLNVTGDSSNLSSAGAGGTSITFSPKGTATIVENTSVIVIFDSDAPSSRDMKCIVVSSGVGLMRTGDYTASTPPASGANVNTTAAQCVTPS